LNFVIILDLKKYEAAPKITKTVENPTVNKKVGIKFTFF
jgi:hypothetical protein